MTETQTSRTPLARLVLFMICLSIAGSFVAGLHYAAIDLPRQQQELQVPTNGAEPQAGFQEDMNMFLSPFIELWRVFGNVRFLFPPYDFK